MPYRKKLIEVAFPLDAVNDASAYDKMPGIGPHPKGIHHWWARLPLPAARAILFASLVDDPSSDPAFATQPEDVQDKERERLFGVIREMLQKKIHEHPDVFQKAYAEIVRSCSGNLPNFLDPFNGGGSIPLEAQRLGLNAQSSDLNPVAVLITKALIEIVPKFAARAPVNPETRGNKLSRQDWAKGRGLADDVRFYGNWMLEEASRRIGHLYPKAMIPREYGGGQASVIAWQWARTVECPNPACKAQMPLVRSFWLSTKKGKKVWVDPVVDRANNSVRFEVKTTDGVPPQGTVNKRGARCLVCEKPAPLPHIRAEGRAGRINAQLMAIVTEGARKRIYISPTEEHALTAQVARPTSAPETDLPQQALGFRVQLYGLTKHRDLFTPRQLLALTTFSDLVKEARERILADAREAGGWSANDERSLHQNGGGAIAYADAVATFLAFAVDRSADFNNSLCRWKPSGEQLMQLFCRQVIPMVWDYAEANIFGIKAVCWKNTVEIIADAIETIPITARHLGQVSQLDAASATRSGASLIVSTDPPYYDNIGYADLSDFFYVWLRRSIGSIYPDLFSTVLVPKSQELVAAPERFDNDKEAAKNHFEGGFRKAFTLIKDRLDPRFPLTVYYAFKQSDDEDDSDDDSAGAGITLTTGWETMLEALISTGFQITGTWPVRASQEWRMRSMGSNALASYIVLACRPRPESSPLATRREFVNALKKELPAALKNLQHGNVAPVDMAQATIGPGMAVFSRYAKVLEADGNPMSVRSALQIINQELDAYLTAQESEMDRDTRFCLAWFEQYGMNEGPFGVADVLARAKNTAVQGLVEAGVIHSKGGKVRLLKREEYNGNWDPVADSRVTVWECTQHLIQRLNTGGEEAAARLVNRLGGGRSEEARALAYRLFSLCEKNKWADEALAYNTLVVSWPAIQDKASQLSVMPSTQGAFQYE